MSKPNIFLRSVTTFIICLLALSVLVPAQKKSKKSKNPTPQGTAVMWEEVDISRRDLLSGPGGESLRPDLSQVTFVKKESGGSSKKYRIKDANGRVWVAKIDKESQPETAAVRLLWAVGYKTEINYLAPRLTIPGKGTFENVRLEARPENVERLGRWDWKRNSFKGTNEFQGLKIMMALLNNWDLKNGNNLIVQDGSEHYYVISDLGATFGKYGSNNLPIFWRIGRSINKPVSYSKSKFIDRVKKGRIDFAFKGKNSGLFKDISVGQGRWLADLLLQLSDDQIADAFRAANYSAADVNTLTRAVKNRIQELDSATTVNLAELQFEKE